MTLRVHYEKTKPIMCDNFICNKECKKPLCSECDSPDRKEEEFDCSWCKNYKKNKHLTPEDGFWDLSVWGYALCPHGEDRELELEDFYIYSKETEHLDFQDIMISENPISNAERFIEGT